MSVVIDLLLRRLMSSQRMNHLPIGKQRNKTVQFSKERFIYGRVTDVKSRKSSSQHWPSPIGMQVSRGIYNHAGKETSCGTLEWSKMLKCFESLLMDANDIEISIVFLSLLIAFRRKSTAEKRGAEAEEAVKRSKVKLLMRNISLRITCPHPSHHHHHHRSRLLHFLTQIFPNESFRYLNYISYNFLFQFHNKRLIDGIAVARCDRMDARWFDFGGMLDEPTKAKRNCWSYKSNKICQRSEVSLRMKYNFIVSASQHISTATVPAEPLIPA